MSRIICVCVVVSLRRDVWGEIFLLKVIVFQYFFYTFELFICISHNLIVSLQRKMIYRL